MLKLTVKTTGVLKLMEKCEKQTRFALAKTFTGAAFEARSAVQANLPKWLILRNKFLERSVIVDKADKQNLTAYVGFHKKANFAKTLEEGGTRRPRGRTIAVPQGVRASENRLVPKRLRPSALRNRKDVFRKTVNGTDGLWQLLSGGRIKLLYAFDESTQYEVGKIHFRKTASAVALKHIAQNAEKNYTNAMRTSR